jgi:hypothetical protein
MKSVSWSNFEAQAPEISRQGDALIHQYGIGLGFIGTVRKDGGPRLHPCCPILHDGGLYVFILGRSPKRYDLDRDGRYALHSNPCADNDDEFYCSGTAHRIEDHVLRDAISGIAKHAVGDEEVLYELEIDRALHTTWKNPRQPDTEPIYSKWLTDD